MRTIDWRKLQAGLRVGLALAFMLGAFGAAPGNSAQAQGGDVPANFTWVVDDTVVYGSADYEFEGYEITLALDDPATPETPDYQGTSYVADGEVNFNYGFMLLGRSGVTATFTSAPGAGYRSYILPPLSVTSLSYIDDTVSGVAEPFTPVRVGTLDNVAGAAIALRTVTADTDGRWAADFAVPGPNPGEETIADILPFQTVDARVDLPAGDELSSMNNTPDPRIVALPERNMVRSRQYPVGSTVTLTIEDPAFPGVPVYTDTQLVYGDPLDPWSGGINFNLGGFTTLTPGMLLTMTDGVIDKTFELPYLQLALADATADLVYGQAAPGKRVFVRVFDESGEIYKTQLRPYADENGYWEADFSGMYDLLSSDFLQIYIQDGDRDKTQIETNAVNTQPDSPIIVTRYDINAVRAYDFETGSSVNLKVYDPGGGLVFDQTRTAEETDPSLPEIGLADFFLGSAVQLGSGYRLVADNGLTLREHIVRHVVVDGVDAAGDRVWGRADPGIDLAVRLDCGGECPERWITAAPDGAWSADFSTAVGPEIWEAAYDLQPTSIAGAFANDEQGNVTRSWYNLPEQNFRRHQIAANVDRIDAYDWTPGNTLTLTIDDPANGPGADYSDTATVQDRGNRRPRAVFTILDFNITPGMTITVADEFVSESLTAVALEVTAVDAAADTVEGIGPPNSFLTVELPCDVDPCAYRRVPTDGAGFWTVDFSQPGVQYDEQALADLTDESSLSIEAYDSNSDSWGLYVQPFQPKVIADLTRNQVYSQNWPTNRQVTISVDDPQTPAAPDAQVIQKLTASDTNSQLNFQFRDALDLRPGMVVGVSDDQYEVGYTLAEIAVTAVDLDADTISGTAAPFADVNVYLWTQESWRSAVADENGNWTADFSAPDPNDPAAPGADLTAEDYGQAQTGQGGALTGVVWYSRWNADPAALALPLETIPDLAAFAYILPSIQVHMQLREPLFVSDHTGAIRPAGAQSLEVSADGLVYTVHLRPDARWSDGAPVTAAHFRDGILANLDPATESDFAYQYFDIVGAQDYYEGVQPDPNQVGIAALNDYTLQFTLNTPTAYFKLTLATPASLPLRRDLMDLYGAAWTQPGNFPSSGPYTLFAGDAAHMELRPNPFYHSPEQLTFPTVVYLMIPTGEQTLEAYRDSALDAFYDARWMLYSIERDPALQTEYQATPNPGVFNLMLNSRRAPTDNPVVRQALAAATDRALLFADAYGPQTIASGVLPPDMFGHQGDAVGYPFNPAQARALLATVYPDPAQVPEITLVSNTHQFKYTEAIAAGWRAELGIRVRTVYYKDAAAYRRTCIGRLETCAMNGLVLGWYSDFPDPYDILWEFLNPHNGIMQGSSGWENARYDELLRLIHSETDPALRLEYVHEAERILVQDEAAVIPLYYWYSSALAQPGLYLDLDPVVNPTTRWGWSDMDQDGQGDMSDPCPTDPADACNPAASAAGVVDAAGGALAAGDGSAQLAVPAGALEAPTPLAASSGAGGFSLETDQGEATAAVYWNIGPDGTQFDLPVALTLSWADADNDGVVDDTGIAESELMVFKDFAAISQPCALDPGCDPQANTFTVSISSLSYFVLGVLQAPAIESIQAPLDPVQVGAAVSVSAQVSNLGSAYSAVWNWGDGAQTSGASLSATHVYSQAGVYEIKLTILQEGYAPVSAVYQYVVIYDPAGGFITGGGWLQSPPGAFYPDPSKTGKANYGFVAKYKKNSSVPEGNLEFQLKEAGLKFQSTGLDWLVTSYADGWAILKGRGIADGSGEIYTFMLWMSDAQPDTLALRITWEDALGVHTLFDSSPKAPIGGGSLTLHKPK